MNGSVPGILDRHSRRTLTTEDSRPIWPLPSFGHNSVDAWVDSIVDLVPGSDQVTLHGTLITIFRLQWDVHGQPAKLLWFEHPGDPTPLHLDCEGFHVMTRTNAYPNLESDDTDLKESRGPMYFDVSDCRIP